MSDVFRVNGYQENWQRNPAIAVFGDGSFFIAYESYVRDTDRDLATTAILLQRYDAFGQPVGGEEVVDAINGSNSGEVRVAVLDDGGYAMAWAFDDFGPILTNRKEVYVRAYDADGTPRTDAIRADTVPANDAEAPEIFATEDGGFTVTFGVNRSSDLFDQIYRQRFDGDGTPIGNNALVNVTEGQFDELRSRAAPLADGRTITVWNAESALPNPPADIDSNQMRGMLTAPDGRVLRADFPLAINWGSVAGGSGGGYDVVGLHGGGFALSNMNFGSELGLDTTGVFYTMLRLFDGGGDAVGTPILVYASERRPSDTRLTQLDTGEIVVVWAQPDEAGGTFRDMVYGRMFAADGTALTGRFDVSTDIPDFADQEAPEIAALPGGGFVVSFTSEAIDADDEGIAARIFGRGSAEDDRLAVDATGQMAGLAGDDTLTGDTGDNSLAGGDGADRLRGKAGADSLTGGKGADSLKGESGADRLVGNGGADTLVGGKGPDWLGGGAAADRLSGGNGGDVLFGQSGRDDLSGGRGADRLGGGGGLDTLAGGAGRDVFVFAPGDRRDTVADFRDGADKIDLTAWDLADFDALTQAARLTEPDDATVTLDFGGGQALTLIGASLATLGQADFLF